MSLNIKNEETHRLVRELAELTGESQTEAVTEAVRERLVRVRNTAEQRQARIDAVMAIARDISERLGPEWREMDAETYLYDPEIGIYDPETGLPR